MGKFVSFINFSRPLLYIVAQFVWPFVVQAQLNLVQNPGFEKHTGCPHHQNQLHLAPPWYNPCNFNPDYYNACDTLIYSVPYNQGIAYQPAASGIAYAGISTYSYAPNLREYLGQTLQHPLNAGYNYAMGFKVALSEGCSHALDLLGAAIVRDSIECSQTVPYISLINLFPQVCNKAGNVLTDTMNWTLIADTFQAIGGEKYLLIGNFFDDKTNTIIAWNWPFTNTISYYYIDDVFLYELGPSPVGIEGHEALPEVTIYPNPATDRTRLKFSVPLNTPEIEIAVYDLSGRLVLSDKCMYYNNGCELNVASLLNGSYICVAQTGGGRQCRAKFSIIRN